MPKRSPPSQRELDISWRTRELGPEMCRELFQKAFPSVKLASQPDDQRELHARNQDDRRRPSRREGAGSTGRDARATGRREPDRFS